MNKTLEILRNLEYLLVGNLVKLLTRHLISGTVICIAYSQIINLGVIMPTQGGVTSSLFCLFAIVGILVHKNFDSYIEKLVLKKYDEIQLIKKHSAEIRRIIIYTRDIRLIAEENAKECFLYMSLSFFLLGSNIMLLLEKIPGLDIINIANNMIIILLVSAIISAIISFKTINKYISYYINIYELKGYDVY